MGASRLPRRASRKRSEMVIHSPYEDVDLAEASLADYVFGDAERYGDKLVPSILLALAKQPVESRLQKAST